MQGFIVAVIIKVLSDAKVQQIIRDMLGQLITERIVPLIPLAVAAATKAVTQALPDVAAASVEHVTEAVREELNNVLPDFVIPDLNQLIDFWRPK